MPVARSELLLLELALLLLLLLLLAAAAVELPLGFKASAQAAADLTDVSDFVAYVDVGATDAGCAHIAPCELLLLLLLPPLLLLLSVLAPGGVAA